MAEFLDGAWVVPPPKDWNASHIAYAGYVGAVIEDSPVLIMTPQSPQGHQRIAKAYITDSAGRHKIKNPNMPVLVTPNPDGAMFKLAKFARRDVTGKVVAITGSVGKTSTKEMLSGLLKTFGTCVYNFRTQNKLIGIRSVMASLITNPDYAVFEISSHMFHAKLRNTVNAIRPDVAIITQICLSHADELGFKSEADVALCKARIAENIRYGGACLINHEIAEYELLKKTVTAYGARPVSYGLSDRSDVWITHASESDKGFFVSANIFGNEVNYEIPYFGLGFALNSVAALAAVHILGEDVTEAARRLAYLPPAEHRMSIHTLSAKGGFVKLIDDCFNAQPLSVINALSALKLMSPLSGSGRKIAILGDIRTFSNELIGEYRTLIGPILDSADAVYLVGKDILTLKDELPAGIVAGEFPDIDAAAKELPDLILPNDIILTKISSATDSNRNLALKLLKALK
jgi:UDP-N-acetylmuramyl pentapeptide synthase